MRGGQGQLVRRAPEPGEFAVGLTAADPPQADVIVPQVAVGLGPCAGGTGARRGNERPA